MVKHIAFGIAALIPLVFYFQKSSHIYIYIYISKENRVGDTIAKYENADKLLLTIPRFKCLI